MAPLCEAAESPLHCHETNIPEMDIFQLPSLTEQINTMNKISFQAIEKKVRFSNYSEMYYIPHLEDMTQEELDATYMNDVDFQRIKQENSDTLHIMKQRKYPGNPTMYFRGLEVLLPRRRMMRKMRIASVVSTVLQIQSYAGLYHPAWVQSYICALTAPSSVEARAMGVWDAEAQMAEETARETTLKHTHTIRHM